MSRRTFLLLDPVEVSVLDAYSGEFVQGFLDPQGTFKGDLDLHKLYGWYDLIITVAGDMTFNYRLAVTSKPEITPSRIPPSGYGYAQGLMQGPFCRNRARSFGPGPYFYI